MCLKSFKEIYTVRIVFLEWLVTKNRESGLPCHFARTEERNSYLSLCISV